MGYSYKGFEIHKTSRFGYTYWKITGEKMLYSTMKEAKLTIDRRS